MGKTLTFQPLTRIKTRTKMVINLDDNGNVTDAHMSMLNLRGFEQFCIGRPAEEMPRIVNRICGVCSCDHHLAANKAVEMAFGVSIPEAARKLRRLMQHLAWIQNKILQFYFLTLPDFLITEPPRDIMALMKANSELALKAIKMRQLGAMLVEHFAGKVIHPIVVVPGGFSKPMTETEREELLKGAEELLEFAKWTMDFAKKEVFPKYSEIIEKLGVIKTGFIGMVDNGGNHEIYDGKLRLMKADGEIEEFNPEEYADYIAEDIQTWSYAKFPHAKKWGDFALEFDNPTIYRSNCLARINVCEKMPTPLAQAELEEFREKFGRPCQYTLLYNYARLIELLCNAESAVEILKDKEITDQNVRAKFEIKEGRGVGCVETPQGTLIHDYEIDKNGFVTKINIIEGPDQNAAAINLSLKQAAKQVIKDGKYDEAALNQIEMIIRAYAP
ncbi:MAG: Ni/Fe hydrogenase subunit alpha [Candidatus Desulfofervidus auxilii]|nr:Ni/Fe hydrogenase subunit alpha [Candidatus Desulfofervidus auxilii]